jgi:hypothetical protein
VQCAPELPDASLSKDRAPLRSAAQNIGHCKFAHVATFAAEAINIADRYLVFQVAADLN